MIVCKYIGIHIIQLWAQRVHNSGRTASRILKVKKLSLYSPTTLPKMETVAQATEENSVTEQK